MLSETSLSVPTGIQNENPRQCVVVNTTKIGEIVSYLITHPLVDCIRKQPKLVKPLQDFVDMTVKQKIDTYLNSKSENIMYNVNQQCVNSMKQRLVFLDHMISTMVNNPGLFTAEDPRDQS
ncbi:hypothetical protein PR048_016960 [Dryococelus australis]|uniref:Uncharacterized protein n=1 Tax=Dryococelus australis TaxID=614101 RepID=A0ABQ9H879_9NEOP|nr:hypothetical protein PR048_016960 [Dryococelus australis]